MVGKDWLGRARYGKAGKAWRDKEGLELAKAWQGKQGMVGKDWLGRARYGKAGKAWHDKEGLELVKVWQGRQGKQRNKTKQITTKRNSKMAKSKKPVSLLDIREFTITIVGDSSLICHNWDEKPSCDGLFRDQHTT